MAITPETELERDVISDPEWAKGAAWGDPRPGHPEGAVSAHIEEVLVNIDDVAIDDRDRTRLRFVALIHDTFKNRVDRDRPREGDNHHAVIARCFAERYTDDVELLDVIELHDEAFNAWVNGSRGGKWDAAQARAHRLISRRGDGLAFYLRFYEADNRTGSKDRASLEWFQGIAEKQQ